MALMRCGPPSARNEALSVTAGPMRYGRSFFDALWSPSLDAL